MSYLERRTRKGRAGQTAAQLYAWRCGICMEKISHADYAARRNVISVAVPRHGLAFQLSHVVCPTGPAWAYRAPPAGLRLAQ